MNSVLPLAPERRFSMPWRVVHWLIIGNLLAQMFYIGWQVFVVLQPPGRVGPAFGSALELPFETMVVRRMYAMEGWFAFLALAIYLGITEILPRTLADRRAGR